VLHTSVQTDLREHFWFQKRSLMLNQKLYPQNKIYTAIVSIRVL